MWFLLMMSCELLDVVSDVPSTLVQDVRTVAMVVTPPEVGANGNFVLQPAILDPLGRRLDVLAWICVPDGDGCFDPSGSQRPQAIFDWSDGRFFMSAPPLQEELLLLGEPLPVPIYVLACGRGMCPIIEEASDYDADVDAIQRRLADVDTLLQDLPEEGVWLSVHSVRVTANLLDPNQNPRLELEPESEGGCDLPERALSPGERIDVCVVSSDSDGGPLVSYAFSTAGRFTSARERIRGRRAQFTYVAPSAEELALAPDGLPVDAVFVAEEDDGAGSAVLPLQFVIAPSGQR